MAFFRRRKKSRVALAIFLILFVYGVVNFFSNRTDIRATISKETTVITEPLRADGYPDYIAALNQLSSKGVTPENNAAVLFWKAMGPNWIGRKIREEFYKSLGIPPLPEKGEYFVDFDKYADRVEGVKIPDDPQALEKRQEELMKQQGEAMRRPWLKKEFPSLAGWLAANEKPLALLIQASKRPRRYDPLVGESVMEAELPAATALRSVTRALLARAMLRLHEGRADDAWDDVLACHRLTRLAGQCQRTAVEALVTITVESIAIIGDCAVLQHANLTAAQIAKMRNDLAKLPSMPKMVETIDVGERYMCLDNIIGMVRQKTDAEKGEKNLEQKNAPPWLTNRALDWPLILRMGNSVCDRTVAAMRKPTRDERENALDELDKSLKAELAEIRSWKTLASAVINRRETISRVLGLILSSLVFPSDFACNDAQDRITMMLQLDTLAFALAAYHADHSSYPAKLADLTPKYIAQTPKDIFNHDADLHYSQAKGGYLLYSVGTNGKDDGGKGYDDHKNGEDWDDLAVRAQLPGSN